MAPVLVEPLSSGVVQYSYGGKLVITHLLSESMIFSKYFPPQLGSSKRFFCNNANSAILLVLGNLIGLMTLRLEDMELAKRLVSKGGLVGNSAKACVNQLQHENWQQVKRRFEREAIALQVIYPEVILRRRDVIRYFTRGVIRDCVEAFPLHFSFKVLVQIICYRYYQFSGSYCGNHSHKVISNSLRDLYFYPSPSKP